MSKCKILFFMSGSVAAFKACHVISRLVQDGHEVQVVATPSTFHFVGAATLEGLSGKKVLQDLWESGRAMDHIHLTRWADFAVLCPASANTLAKMAHGLADDLVSAMALAWPPEKPFVIVPAMNLQMLKSEATQSNLATLRARGFRVTPTASGSLACGENGEGRMLEPEDILARLPTSAQPLGRVLVTAGATREPIDGIRYISNKSTGQTGADLADRLQRQGWDVTFLGGVGSLTPKWVKHSLTYNDFADLNEHMRGELSQHDYAGVIHCAAVSDYSVENPRSEIKLSSQAAEMHLRLKANFKILPRLKEYSRNKNIRVVGFKLTLNQDPTAAARTILAPTVDAVVAKFGPKFMPTAVNILAS